MVFAYLAYLQEYWWILLTVIFGLLMFGGRRLDLIIEWLTERKMKRLYPELSKRYEEDIVDQDTYLSELLGVDVRLDDLVKRVYEINDKLISNNMERVTYLELWILSKLYGKYMQRSDDHIYYVNSNYFIRNLDLSLKSINHWALEFANSREIKEMKISASFLLHKIRTKDPVCDPKNSLESSVVAGAVFNREYFFSSEDVSLGIIKSEMGRITLKNGDIIEVDASGYHNIGNEQDMTLKERIDLDSTDQNRETSVGNINEDKKREGYKENPAIKVKEILEDGSRTLVDEKGRTHTVRSRIDVLEKKVNDKKEIVKDEETPEMKKPLLHKKQEISQVEEMEENIDMMQIIFSGTAKDENKKEKEGRKTAEPSDRKDLSTFLQDLPSDNSIFEKFLQKEENEIYYCEDQKLFFISLVHLLKFLDESIVLEDELSLAIFDGSKFNQELLDKIVDGLSKAMGKSANIENIKRRSFHRAEEGYKEIYTFAVISGLKVTEEYPDKITRGIMSNKYNKAKHKVFVENYKDL